jgi:hypothetical protein
MSLYRSSVRSVALASLLVLAASPPAAHAGVCGDVNGDDEVLSSDALNVLRKAVGQPLVLDCPLEEELQICERDLAAYQPVECPCFHGPASLNSLLAQNVTGTPIPLYAGECTELDGSQTLYYGFDSSFPNPGVSGDGKCRVSIEFVASPIAMPYRCSITQTIDEADIDCDTFQTFPTVSINITQQQAIACKQQATQAAGISTFCAH